MPRAATPLLSLLAVFSALACGGGERNPPPPAPPPAPTAPEETPERSEPPPRPELAPGDLAPRFSGGAAGRGARLLSRGDFAGARAAFAEAREGEEDAADGARLALLVAFCDARLGRHRAAAAGFEAAAEELPLLADFARARAAVSAAAAGAPDRVLSLAAGVDDGSPFVPEAALAAGRAALELGEAARARTELERFLERSPEPEGRYFLARVYEARRRRAEARFLLARALESAGERAAAAEQYRAVAFGAPLSPRAEEAEKAAARLGAADPPSAGELFTRGHALFEAMRNEASEADFDAVLEREGIDAADRCAALFFRAQSVYKQREYRRAAPLFAPAREACEAAGEIDLAVKSAYQHGRSLTRIGKRRRAIAAFAAVEQHPEHSYADDARLRRARQHSRLGEDDRARELLASLPERYPEGDMRGEALWRLASDALDRDDREAAVSWLKKTIEIIPIETDWRAEGRAEYWLGRALADLGRAEESADAYEACVETYPLTYYAVQALARLRGDHPERYRELEAEIRGAVPSSPPPFEITQLEELGREGFARAAELIRLGLTEPAAAELSALGLTVPPGKAPVEDAGERDRLWTIAFLYDRAGRHDLSHWIARWHALDYERSWPDAESWAKWRIAYPDAFRWLIDRAAEEHTYPAPLQMGIVREESAFDPVRESYANAIGLTQMIFPTARRFAEGTGIAVTRENLRDPEKNVAIGSNFLDFLWQTFDGRPGLAVPAYNAGEHRVWRWIWRMKPAHLDAFIEDIPIDQARGYTKRVLGSYFAYSWLWNQELPLLRDGVPLDLVPRRKRR